MAKVILWTVISCLIAACIIFAAIAILGGEQAVFRDATYVFDAGGSLCEGFRVFP